MHDGIPRGGKRGQDRPCQPRPACGAACGGRHGEGDATRPVGPLDARSPEHAGDDQRQGCYLPLPRRCMGRHHHAARAIDVDGSGWLAEFERELIRNRTSGGRESAKGRGGKFGAKPKFADHQKREAIRRRERASRCRALPAATTSAGGRF